MAALCAGSVRVPARAAGKTYEIPYRTLGRTGEKVSLVGLGGYHIGVPADESESIKIIRSAIDSGVNFMDNCWDYNSGVSEERMGKALRDGYRKRVFLMTKIDGRTKESAARQIDECLKRFQTDMIDCVQIHEVIRASDPEKCFAPNGTMEALIDAKKAGKLKYIGFTGHKSPEIHLKMLDVAFKNGFTFDTVQMPLNVMDAHYDSFEKLVIPVLLQHNIGILGMKSLGAGIILQSGISARECHQYAMSLPVSVMIAGFTNMDQLHQALATADRFQPLTASEINQILEKTKAHAMAGKFELYKSTYVFDGTRMNPQWMG